MTHLKVITDILVEIAGPLSQIVVVKTFKDFGITGDTIPPDKIKPVIEAIAQRAVFDNTKREYVKNALTKLLS